MQAEVTKNGPPAAIDILGINETGQEAGNPDICAGRSLPWLQDTAAQNVWGSWHVTWRDVVVLDRLNQRILVYNLTVHDLADSTNYNELRAALLAAARAP